MTTSASSTRNSYNIILLPDIENISSQQPRSTRTSHSSFALQRQGVLHPRFRPWLPRHHARRLRYSLDVRSQRAFVVGCRRSRVYLGERATKTSRVDFTWRVAEDALRLCCLWAKPQLANRQRRSSVVSRSQQPRTMWTPAVPGGLSLASGERYFWWRKGIQGSGWNNFQHRFDGTRKM